MGVVIVCSALLLLGVAGIVRWRKLEFRSVGAPLEPGAGIANVARWYLWWVAVGFYVAIGTGLTIVGPGGRLAMRILAATAGSAAQGRVTEADEIVGRITIDGTIGLFIFVGLFFAIAATVGYMLVRSWLPAGLSGGALCAFVLVAVAATRLDPLRRDNRDFDIVGPGWLAVVIYILLTLLEGLALAAFAGRISRAMPEISRRSAVWLAYVPLLILLVPPTVFVVVVGFAVALIVTGTRTTLDALRSRRLVLAGRLGLAIVVLASLPAAISALVNIAGRP